MTYGTILRSVQALLADMLPVAAAECVPAAQLAGDLGADSLDMFEIAVKVDDFFGIEVGDDDIEGWFFVKDVVNSIVRILGSVQDADMAVAS